MRTLLLVDAKRLAEAGVDALHVDDWEMNASWVRHADCIRITAPQFTTWGMLIL